MYSRLRFYQARLQRIFFGPPYVEADHRALTPRGTATGIRRVLLVVGAVLLGLMLVDLVARLFRPTPTDPWQFVYQIQTKSARVFRGVHEPGNVLNEHWNGSDSSARGDLARLLDVSQVNAPYLAAENRTPKRITTDAEGFRRAGGDGVAPVILAGDSFFDFDTLGDSLSVDLGIPVINRAIPAKQTLSMARTLEAFNTLHQPRVIIWEHVERALSPNAFAELSDFRVALRHDGWRDRWMASLGWPENIERYLTASSEIRQEMIRLQAELLWRTTGDLAAGVVRGRTDTGYAPMLFAAGERGLLKRVDSLGWVDAIVDVIEGVTQELRQQGTTLVFTVGPDKSNIYRERLPDSVSYHAGSIGQLNRALKQRGIKVIDLETGLRAAALDHPDLLYYYTTDTHWSPRGQALAAHIIADSLKTWFPDLSSSAP